MDDVFSNLHSPTFKGNNIQNAADTVYYTHTTAIVSHTFSSKLFFTRVYQVPSGQIIVVLM